MLKSLKITCILLFLILFSSCGAIKDAIDAIASLDSCSDFDSISSALNEACRELEGLLPDASDSLTSKTQILSIVKTADNNYYDAVLLISDSSGSAVTTLANSGVVAEKSTDGVTYTSVTTSSFDKYQDLPTTETQLSFASIIDYSGSVLDSDLDDVNSALTTLYQNLPAFYRSEIVKFSASVTVYPSGGFSTDQTELLTDLQDTSFSRSSTAMYDGIYDAVEDLASETTTLKLGILFTDGQDNSSSKTYTEVKALFQDNGIPVCVVGVGFADLTTLQTIASDSGCFYIYKPAFSGLDSAFTAIVSQINNFYRVRFNASDLLSGDTLKMTVTVPSESSARDAITAIVP